MAFLKNELINEFESYLIYSFCKNSCYTDVAIDMHNDVPH